MKNILISFFLLAFLNAGFSQLNMELVSNLPYDSKLNDIWGYTAPDGTEYALIGLRDGVSIVSLADPADPVELHRIDGAQSTWRDLRTWEHYCYVVTDQPNTKEGLLVIDMSGLPDNIEYQKIQPVYPDSPDSLFTCHNVWVDEKGFAYLTGCNYDPSNVIFLDLNNDPYTPEFAGYGIDIESHDGYARSDTFYSAEIFEGQFSVYDVTDKSNPMLLATQATPFEFCHNVWLSDDSKTIFTTDERRNASTAAYDISDLSNIRFLDEFRPQATIGTGVIPHNVHVLNDYLVIAHYTDGCVIVDANEPDNLIEVANWDTNQDFVDGFHGAWGAYPYFSSGLIVISDIENGLFVLRPDYKRASYLEGKVTDGVTGASLIGAEVEIQTGLVNFETTDFTGQYRTGLATPGTYDVLFRAKGYFDLSLQASISSGETTVLDAQMVPLPPHRISGSVVEKETGLGIDSAVVFIQNDDFSYTTYSAADGSFELPAVLQGEYKIQAGKWGYENFFLENRSFMTDDELTIEIGQAYEDNFNVDLGWQSSGDASKGLWVRGIPFGTFGQGGTEFFNPFEDSSNDPGNHCFVTGNDPVDNIFVSEVSDGAAILTSPPMELASRYNRPLLSYDAWFYNIFFQTWADDTLTVYIDNGLEMVELEALDTSQLTQAWRPSAVFDLAKFITLTDNMRLIVQVTDRTDSDNVTEGGLDNFKITEGIPDELFVVNDEDNQVKIRAYPNPFGSFLNIDYVVQKDANEIQIEMYDVLGRLIEEVDLLGKIGTVSLAPDAPAGVYFVTIRLDDELSEAIRVVKGQ